MASLGDVLRRTRTLYSYDHKSTILKEAVICGCRVLVVMIRFILLLINTYSYFPAPFVSHTKGRSLL